MARSLYFAFDYEDVKTFRANVVRKSGGFRNSKKFKDSSIWEEAKEKSPTKIKALIDNSLQGTSVTCVLVGSGTYSRRYVRYEIVKSFVEKKGLVGVRINWIKGKDGNTKFWPGENPFEYLRFQISADGSTIHFFEYKDGWIPFKDLQSCKNKHFPDQKYWGKKYQLDSLFTIYSYDWHDGKKNLVDWVEEAANKMGR